MKTMVLILVGSCSLLCQTANEPIPSEWLHDGHFAPPDFNFSIDSPSSDSQWSRQELKYGATGFTVTDSSKESYVIFVMDHGDSSRMDEPVNKRHFLESMQKSIPQGWLLGKDSTFEQSTFPTNGSWKINTSIQREADGYILHCYLYMVTGRRGYSILTYTAEPTEPRRFHDFVSSFTLLSPSDNVLPDSTAQNSSLSFFFLLALSGAIFDWKYKRRGGIKPTWRQRSYLFAAMLLCAAFLTYLGLRGSNPEALGNLTAFFLVILFGVWEIGRMCIRRDNPLSAVIPAPTKTQESPISLFCSKCGGRLTPDVEFCGTCGTRRFTWTKASEGEAGSQPSSLGHASESNDL